MGLVTLIFDLLTLNWYASRIKGGEPSFQIRARYRPLGFRIIRYVRDGQTGRRANGRTKATLITPSLRGRGITMQRISELFNLICVCDSTAK